MDGSCTDTGKVSCSHSKSRELTGVDEVVGPPALDSKALTSRHCSGMSLWTLAVSVYFLFVDLFNLLYVEGGTWNKSSTNSRTGF